MKEFDYKAFYDQVGAENGWNFSNVRCQTEGHEINIYDELRKRAHGTEVLLDIGTGGGEAVLPVSDSVLLAIGIDRSLGMISTANKNLMNTKSPNVRFLLMDASCIAFPDGFFDLVTCRHSDFSVREVARILTQNGLFITQQVSEKDKANIKAHFGRGQAYGVKQGTLKEKYIRALQDAGFHNIQTFESDVTEYYSRPEDLIFLLKHTPIVPGFGEADGDFKVLDAFIQAHMTERGIATNAARFMILANK